MYRRNSDHLQFLLVHPGGPFFRNKDDGVWTIPKGEIGEQEDALAAAKREFGEEVGIKPEGKFIKLTPIQQKGGKIVQAWAVEGDFDPAQLKSNFFVLEWPPRSGRSQEFPEVDRAEWFDPQNAKGKINPAQWPLLEELQHIVADSAAE